MKDMRDIALSCIENGWYVFPCWPRTKQPLTPNGFKAASNNKDTVGRWWKFHPDANVAIATGASGLTVVDIDHGISNQEFLRVWLKVADYSGEETYTVRTGRTDGFGAQMYFKGGGLKSTGWKTSGVSGDIRSATGYVMAAGCLHPSGERYTVLFDRPVRPEPEWVRSLSSAHTPADAASEVEPGQAESWKSWLLAFMVEHAITDNGYEKRVPNGWWLGIECPWIAEHTSGAESSTVLGILDGKLAFECSHGTCKSRKRNTKTFKDLIGADIDEPGADPPVTLGIRAEAEVAEVEGVYSFFDTADQILNAEPVEFVVNNIIPKNRYTGFVALSGSRKTIIACNLVRSVLLKEPFLGRFAIDNAPSRVIFLAAESARSEIKERAEELGFTPFIKSRELLIRTAATSTPFHQDQLPDSLLDGALVVLDTFIRFFDGLSEQDSTEARKFSKQMQRMVNAGATVIVLFHAPKGAKNADEMSIESIRGSSELGAAMACCWGLAMLGKNWSDNTRMEQVKRREFQCEPPVFDFSCDERTALCQYVEATAEIGTGDRLEEDERAETFMQDHPDLAARALAKQCKAELGIDRSYGWFQRRKKDE